MLKFYTFLFFNLYLKAGADASANDSSDKCSDSLSGSNPELDQEGNN